MTVGGDSRSGKTGVLGDKGVGEDDGGRDLRIKEQECSKSVMHDLRVNAV